LGEGKIRVEVAQPQEIEREVARIRGRIGDMVQELDRRRHELTDWKLQARRHGGKLAIAGVAVAALIGLSVVVKTRRKRRQRHIVSIVPADKAPEKPSLLLKVAAAALSALAATLAKRVAEEIVHTGRLYTTTSPSPLRTNPRLS
jgi:hypothetical protein